MSSSVLVCTGEVSVTPDGAPLCSVAWLVQPAPEPFDVSLIDPALVAEAFAVGFAVVASVWLISYPIKVVLSLLR